MRHSTIAIGAFVMAALLWGCAEPEMLFHATPTAPNTVWYSGREYVSETKDSITVSVAFENEINRTMTFYAVVGNFGSDTVLVAPEKIYYAGHVNMIGPVTDYETMRVTYDTVNRTDIVHALDPESELQALDRQQAQASAAYANQTGLNSAAAILNIVGAVSTIGQNKTREERHQEERNRREVSRSQTENNENYSIQSTSIAEQRAYWANAMLRKTTLFPGSAIGGNLRIPVDKDAGSITLYIPIGATTFSFDFNQKPLLTR